MSRASPRPRSGELAKAVMVGFIESLRLATEERRTGFAEADTILRIFCQVAMARKTSDRAS